MSDLLVTPALSDKVLKKINTLVSHLFSFTVFADFYLNSVIFFPLFYIKMYAVRANFLIHFLLINVLRFIIVCSSFLTDFLFCLFKLRVCYLYFYIRHIAWCFLFVLLIKVVFCYCEMNFFKVKVKCSRCFYKLFKQRKVRERGKTKNKQLLDAELR